MKFTSQIGRLLIVIGLASVASGEAPGRESQAKQFDAVNAANDRQILKSLQTAAAMSRVKLDVRTITTLNGNGARTSIAALAGLDSIPATSWPKGVDVAFGFFHLPQGPGGATPPLPVGFYTIRITASQQAVDASLKQNVGTPQPDPRSPAGHPSVTNAQAEFLDGSGKVIAKVPAAVGVWALDGLPTGKKVRSFVEPTGGGQNRSMCMHMGEQGGWHVYWVCWGNTWIDDIFLLD
jgi:hypothetical protein